MRRSLACTVAPLFLFVAACGGGSTSHSSSGGSGTGGAGGAGGMGETGGTGGTGGAGGTGGTGGTGGSKDAGTFDASPDAGPSIPCTVGGNPGECMLVSDCAALPGHSSTPGFCPGPADIECCTVGPSVSDNPPIPAGYKPMMQSEVTPAMTTWAVAILHDPTTYPMFSTAMMTFGTLMVLARVEWHPPDFQNMTVHRGVTLYEPI